jgi:hypothetical protein
MAAMVWSVEIYLYAKRRAVRSHGAHFLDPRLVSIEFRAGEKHCGRDLPTNDLVARTAVRWGVT